MPEGLPHPDPRRSADPLRPGYHFTAPQGWLNDPNGLIQVGGRWHLFYQHNPARPQWGQIHWGHASSADLISWRDHPPALAPTPGGPDEDGCFSGSCALVGGVPTLFYTGSAGQNTLQTQCQASSDDGLSVWHKDPASPLIAWPPADVRRDDFRDPYVFRHADTWYLILGASLGHQQGAALLYRSADAREWAFVRVLQAAERTEQGRIWECPNLIPFGDDWLLTYSVCPLVGARYQVGSFENGVYTARREGVLDTDASAFAHLAARGEDGRVLQWAWIPEQREQAHIDAGGGVVGWAGALSVPRELSVEGGDLRVYPAAEVARQRRAVLLDAATSADEHLALLFSGAHLDIELELPPEVERLFHLILRRSPGGEEETVLTYDADAWQLILTRQHSSLDRRVNASTQRVHLPLEAGEGLRLRVLLDGSVLEAYANGRACLTSRIYPTRADSLHGGVRATRPTGLRLRVWQMPEVWQAEA